MPFKVLHITSFPWFAKKNTRTSSRLFFLLQQPHPLSNIPHNCLLIYVQTRLLIVCLLQFPLLNVLPPHLRNLFVDFHRRMLKSIKSQLLWLFQFHISHPWHPLFLSIWIPLKFLFLIGGKYVMHYRSTFIYKMCILVTILSLFFKYRFDSDCLKAKTVSVDQTEMPGSETAARVC